MQVDSFQNAKAEHYLHMIQTSFAKEDCRIEDGSGKYDAETESDSGAEDG